MNDINLLFKLFVAMVYISSFVPLVIKTASSYIDTFGVLVVIRAASIASLITLIAIIALIITLPIIFVNLSESQRFCIANVFNMSVHGHITGSFSFL